jgi:hypothetical protein
VSDQDAPPPPVFVDLEASSLLPGSYPVEVGWARPRALSWGKCAIEVGSVLVRPEAEWLSSGSWDPNAEAVHGLSRETLLRDGQPAAEICDLLDRAFGGSLVVTDTGGGSVDDMWLAVLYEAAGREPSGWEVAKPTADQIAFDACRAHGLRADLVMAALHWRAPQPTHAAAEDALCDAWRYAMVQQIGRFRVGERDEAGQRAALHDLGRTVPPDCWPRVEAAGRGFRRRA